MIRLRVRIWAILPKPNSVIPTFQKRQRHFEIARAAGRDAADIPSLSLASRRHQHFTHLADEHASFVPPGGNELDEIKAGLTFVSGRIIGDHWIWIIEAKIESEVMSARAQNVRRNVARLELAPRHGPETAEMIIHRPGDEPREGHHQIVFRRTTVTPLQLLEVERALVIHQVRVRG